MCNNNTNLQTALPLQSKNRQSCRECSGACARLRQAQNDKKQNSPQPSRARQQYSPADGNIN